MRCGFSVEIISTINRDFPRATFSTDIIRPLIVEEISLPSIGVERRQVSIFEHIAPRKMHIARPVI